jgi:hypothetical protein
MLYVLIFPLVDPGLRRLVGGGALRRVVAQQRGPHGLSEILYAFTSARGNNGSAFAGINANTPWYNETLGLAMHRGRFDDRPRLAIAGSLAARRRPPARHPADDGPLFAAARRRDRDRGRADVLPACSASARRRAFPAAPERCSGHDASAVSAWEGPLLRRRPLDSFRKLDPG